MQSYESKRIVIHKSSPKGLVHLSLRSTSLDDCETSEFCAGDVNPNTD